MSQKEKPKRKNISPDELLQEACLLYPENEAFVRGESKELHPKMTIFANIRHRKYDFVIDAVSFKTITPEWKATFRLTMPLATIFLCMGFIPFAYWIAFSGDTKVEVDIIGVVIVNLISLPVFLLGIAGFWSLWRSSKIKHKHIQRDYTNLVQHGKLVLGEVLTTHQAELHCIYYSPNTNQRKRINWFNDKVYWHFIDDISLEKGDKVIVLYVDDKLSIVL